MIENLEEHVENSSSNLEQSPKNEIRRENLRSNCSKMCMINKHIKNLTTISLNEIFTKEIIEIGIHKNFLKRRIRRNSSIYIFVNDEIIIISNNPLKIKQITKNREELEVKTYKVINKSNKTDQSYPSMSINQFPVVNN